MGWNPIIFRWWCLFGAMLVAAWLGQGTVYLPVRGKWADILPFHPGRYDSRPTMQG